MKIKSRTIYALIFYLLLCTLAYISKPLFLFRPDGQLRRLGMREEETMFSAVILLGAVAIVSYYVFVLIDFVFE